jgi:hypothetical protein
MGAGPAAVEFVKWPADMRPAEGELHLALLRQRPVDAVAVHLQHALEAREMLDRLLGLAIGGIDISDSRRIGPAPRSVVAGVGPELAGLGSASAGVEHRQGGFVREQLRRGLQVLQKSRVHGPNPPPGNMVVWRGLSRLTDIRLGAELAELSVVGN